MKLKLHSFDVFDTVLTRIWAKPQDLFWEVGQRLKQANLISITPQHWANLRIGAEKQARQKSVTEEVTLKQIYTCLASHLNWVSQQIEQAQKIEIEVELFSLRAIPTTKKQIQALHEQNHRVIYILDMYLPQEIIKLSLEKNQIWAAGDTLYVSSAIGSRKASGSLFKHCLVQESIKPSQLYHLGNNDHSDIKMPKKLGIKTQEFTQTNLNRYEALIANQENLPLEFRSLLAGSIRQTRLKYQEINSRERVIWDTAASVMAPVLLGYVNWCLQEAEKKGIKRLYFVARDGQILLKIARILCKNWQYDVECRYLYGSRQALKFPAIQSISEYELDWIFDFPKVFMSINSVCERVNIKPEQIQATLINYGFLKNMWERNLKPGERELLKELFTKAPISTLIIATATNYRNKVIGYLKQEGLFDKTSFGLVDFGWKGSLQKSFSQLISSVGMYPENGTNGFYFALKRRVNSLPTDRFFAYFFDTAEPSEEHDTLLKYSDLYEALVTADHGSTVRFKQKNNSFVPVFRSAKNQEMLDWGIITYQKSIVEFSEIFSTVISKNKFSYDNLDLASRLLLNTFINFPTKQEAITFGSLQHSPDMTEKILYELAPQLSISLLISMILEDRKLHKQLWKPGLIARNKKITLFLLRICLKWHNFKFGLERKISKQQSLIANKQDRIKQTS